MDYHTSDRNTLSSETYKDVMDFDFIFANLPQYEMETVKICK